ncbi:MAG: Eco57I restriction-modification methylase domain-containing protein, partial [Carboxydocellales bacterium]
MTKLIIFQELRRKIADLDQQLAEVYPERIVRRRQVFERLGKLLREEINLLGPQEQELRLAVLGQVLEALIREEEGKQTGTFYTSREVVTLMCRLALWNYLGQKSHLHGFSWGHLGRLIFTGEIVYGGELIFDGEFIAKSEVDPERGKAVLLDLLRQVRIIDPAVGSGAFLLGMLEELTALRLVLGDNLTTLTIRRQVIEANIFGVDSEAAAIEVVKLRLSLGSGVTPRMVCGDSLFLDWAKQFPEVMAEGGFDIFLANPPYVSQDRLQKSYKDRLVAAYSSPDWPVDRKTDLYAYFYALGARTLRPGGTAVLISSTAWLDVEYGAWLQKFLLANFQVPLIMDSSVERWFGEAAVNTAIIVLNRAGISTVENSNKTAFLNLRQSLTQNTNQTENQLFEELTIIFKGCARNQENSCLRVNALALGLPSGLQSDLQSNLESGRLAGGQSSLEMGDKWGKYLRAPRVYFQLYNYAREKLCCLGDITTLKRGLTTGCNEFFYLKAGQHKAGQQGLVESKYSVESKYLKPVIKSPKETLGY